MRWVLDDRGICAALLVAGGVLLLLRPGARRATWAWALLLAAGLANAWMLNVRPSNLTGVNVVHQYLGAKYAVPYGAFYRLYNAAQEKPPLGIRDLDRPPALAGADERERRAWFLDALRGSGADFDPFAPLVGLERRAIETGAVRRECERVLRECLPANRVESFRRDVAWAQAHLAGREITLDYGFNGSPFYALVRRGDPTLHRPLGSGTGLLNLVLQTIAALLLPWVAGAALGLAHEERIAAAALLFASWDFAGYALAGLTFGEIWLPVALAMLAWRRGRPALAGIAVAWAGLMKLFPFVLVLPAAAQAVRAFPGRQRSPTDAASFRSSLRFLLSCLLATAVLGAVSLLTGRSWGDFLRKILAQFQSQAYLMNSVSLSRLLLTLGIHASALPRLLSLLVAAVLALLCLRRDEPDDGAAGPRRLLVILVATGLLVHTWFNYYALGPLLLLPLVARRHRLGAAAAAFALSAAFLLPDYDDPALRESAALQFAKVAPYGIVPIGLLAWELRPGSWPRRLRIAAVVLVGSALLATAGESWRVRTIRRLDAEGGARLDRGDAAGALELFRRQVRLAPRSAVARLNEGVALATLGRSREAGTALAAATRLDAADLYARRDYGRWLREAGRPGEAVVQLEAARRLAPYDDGILVELALARRQEGRTEDATALLARARELNPANGRARGLWEEQGRP